MSKNVHPAPVPDAVPDGCRTGAGWVPDAKRRSRAFKQKNVYQNRTIIKEVMAKMSIQHRCQMQCRMGAGRVPDGCRTLQNEPPSWNLHKLIFLDIFLTVILSTLVNDGDILTVKE